MIMHLNNTTAFVKKSFIVWKKLGRGESQGQACSKLHNLNCQKKNTTYLNKQNKKHQMK